MVFDVVPEVRFNSQPPEGGWCPIHCIPCRSSSFNSQPPEGGWLQKRLRRRSGGMFQLTAARRRLGLEVMKEIPDGVSFNSQPPEGGWASTSGPCTAAGVFQLTAARRRLVDKLLRLG